MKNFLREYAIRYHINHQPSRKAEERAANMHIEKMGNKRRLVKGSVMAIKIGVGSALAIILATMLGLESPTAAGTITLLTLSNTKKGTFSLIVKRYITFAITVALCLILFAMFKDKYTAFMIFLTLIVFITEWLGWGATLSVNALIGMHFMDQKVIDAAFVYNELILLTLGAGIAFILNLFYAYNNMRLHMFACRKASERALYKDLYRVADFLTARHPDGSLAGELEKTEQEDRKYLASAVEYAGNFYSSAPEAYISFFEMRIRQQVILRSLVHDLQLLRQTPKQAQAVASYIRSITPFIGEIHHPKEQLEKLRHLLTEVENYAKHSPWGKDPKKLSVYYHVLLALKDLMLLKVYFVETLTPEEKTLFFRDLSYTNTKVSTNANDKISTDAKANTNTNDRVNTNPNTNTQNSNVIDTNFSANEPAPNTNSGVHTIAGTQNGQSDSITMSTNEKENITDNEGPHSGNGSDDGAKVSFSSQSNSIVEKESGHNA